LVGRASHCFTGHQQQLSGVGIAPVHGGYQRQLESGRRDGGRLQRGEEQPVVARAHGKPTAMQIRGKGRGGGGGEGRERVCSSAHERIDAVHVGCRYAGVCLQQRRRNGCAAPDDCSHERRSVVVVGSIDIRAMLDEQLRVWLGLGSRRR
jgi:hypothetical protein